MIKKIPYGKQFIDNSDISLVKQSLRGKYITTGNFVNLFEKEIKKKTGSKFALACVNGTAGLHLALLSLNLKKDDAIIMPSINFISSYRVAELLNLKIYLADVDPLSGQMTPSSVESCIKKNKIKKIKVIVTMYLGGYIENHLEFFKLKKKYKCFLVEDACHALGAKYKFNNSYYSLGSCRHSDIAVFSFHPVKNITTGEGGAILTNNRMLAKRIALFRNHGMVKNKNYWKYDIKDLGFNYRLSDINCALGLSQLKKLDKFIKKRKKIFLYYNNNFKKLNHIKLYNYSNKNNGYHLYILTINYKKLKCSKDDFIKKLIKKGINVQFHYPPIYSFSFYKNKNRESFEGSEQYYKNSFSIPVYYSLSQNDQKYIIRNIIDIINKNSKK